MALNFDLLQPANIRENFMAGRKEAQDMETGRLQQQEARMKLDDFQRKQAGLDKFLAAAKQRGKDGDPVDVADDYYNWTISQGSPELITQAITLRQTAQQRKDYFAKQNPNQLAGAVQPVAPIAGALGSGTFDPNAPAPSAAAPLNALAPTAAPSVMTPTNALAPTAAAAPAKQNRIDFIRSELQRLSKYPNVSEAKAEATMLLEEYKRLTTPHVVGGSLMSGSGDIIGTAPERQDTDLIRNYNAAKNQGFAGNIFEYQQKIAAAGRAPATPATPSAPVAVVDPATNKIVYVSREEALNKKMTPASAMEGLSPKEIQTREAKYPAATLAVKTVESSSDRLANDLDELAKHPGLSGISGLVYGNTPAITKSARVALEKYKSILARGGFSELQAMRSSSPTGGALGNVSNQENQYLRDAFAAIGRSQDTSDLKTALENAANTARATKQRVREAYDMTYDYKNQGSAPAAAPGPCAATRAALKIHPFHPPPSRHGPNPDQFL